MCIENERPPTKQKCSPPPNCNDTKRFYSFYTPMKGLNFSIIGSCKGLKNVRRIRDDGEYKLNIRGREIEIYCHGMNTSNPHEYLTLKKGKLFFFNKILKSEIIFQLS